jgi:hypothetical protein
MFGDGLNVLAKLLSVREVASLIEKTARWVDPETFRILPVWYPEYARGKPLHNANWTVVRRVTKKETGEVQEKKEGNTQANIALCKALGTNSKARPNWTCCHIWGVDDPSFARRNTVVKDHRFFTCVGNMLLLPTPLKAFTDVMPEVKAMLRECSATLYGWRCDHPDLLGGTPPKFDRTDYPSSWLKAETVPGIVKISDKIRRDAQQRKDTIKRDLQHAGVHYPKRAVEDALAYWAIKL